jgi:hypothetical protein
VGPALLAIAIVGNVGLMVVGHGERLDRERCEASMDPSVRGLTGSPC